jgi:hypothetical protein
MEKGAELHRQYYGRPPLIDVQRAAIRLFIYIGFLFSGCFFCHSETTNAALKLFVVSQSPIEGGRFIDTKELPKIGYIAEKPDLNLTNLADVWRSKTMIFINPTNLTDVWRSKELNNSNMMCIDVKLHPSDGKRLKALTERAIGKKVLIMVGDRPLLAPTVRDSLEGGFAIESTNEDELKNAQIILEKLVGPAPRGTSRSDEDAREK